MRDAQFRLEARAHLKAFGKSAIERVPEATPAIGSFKLVYAVMGTFDGNVVESLPFFSQMTLMYVAQDLRERGVEVALAKVETG